MPTYDTPEPIAVVVDLGVGTVRLAASERHDTVVEVRPTDETDASDVAAAQEVRVGYTDGTLRVSGPRWRTFDFSRKSRSVDVRIELPSGSQVQAELQVGDLRGAGLLGQCTVKTSVGNLWLERAGSVRLSTSAGDVSATVVTGDAEVATSSGRIRLGEVTGSAVVKNSNGDTEIDSVTGAARLRSSNGDIRLDRAGADVDAKTSNGSIRLGEVARGTVAVGTAMGDLDVGIAAGTAAWLELNTSFGHVRNLLEAAARPEETDLTVEVRGRTAYGDITVRRA